MERTPRPIGSTQLGNSNNQELLQQHIIQSYIQSGFTYCGKPMNIEQFALYIKVEPTTILEAITNRGKDIYTQADPEDQGDLLRALVGTALENALTDRSRAVEQLNILSAAQGHSYKPFISGEVNKALKLAMESTQGILSIAKSIGGNQALSVVINNDNRDQSKHLTQNFLTPDKALEMINLKAKEDDNMSLLDDPDKKQQLYLDNNIEDMPEVKANQQTGLDTSKEGLEFNKLAELSDEKVDRPKDLGHIDRRAQELDVDLDSDQV